MKIAIVNDSVTTTDILKNIIKEQPEYELLWMVSNGDDALHECARQKPDLILLDLRLPGMGGIKTIKKIIAKYSCAILIVTENIKGSHSEIFEAMGNGALDAVESPVGDFKDSGCGELLQKIETIAKLIGKWSGKAKKPSKKSDIANEPLVPPLLAIGSSTGGPKALLTVLNGLPEKFLYPIAIVQHVDVKFSSGLAEWLDSQVQISVKIASKGDKLKPGLALIAGTNDHLTLRKDLTLDYIVEPEDYPYRPSVDVFFESLKKHWPCKDSVAVLLTGMGRDGAKGLLSLKEKGWHTIAQDKGSSVVYGMPKAAADMGAANEIQPLGKIASCILSKFPNKNY
ncbi:chemotaxis-specific protein-glutamate methyltransferase CheB [Candidatus Riflebacteria bacterium]